MSNFFRLGWVGVVTALVLVSGCGKKDDNNTTVNGQAACPVGTSFVNNQCVSGSACPTGTYYNGSQCISGGGGVGTCPNGQIQTQYGCLAQGSCPAGSAYYNGSCVPSFGGGTGGGNYNYCPVGQVLYHGQCVPSHYSGGNTGIPGGSWGGGWGGYWGGYAGYSCQSCGIGYVMTSYGCLPQANCGPCSGNLNGFCVR